MKNCIGPCMPHCDKKTVIIILGICLGISVIINLLLLARLYALMVVNLFPSVRQKD